MLNPTQSDFFEQPKPAPKKRSTTTQQPPVFQVGDRVTNLRGWHGEVVKVSAGLYEGGFYYWVHWQERADHEQPLVRRQPVIGHLPAQISLRNS